MKKAKSKTSELSKDQQTELVKILKSRFEKNIGRHKNIKWSDVEEKLKNSTEKLWSLNEMERTGGEPDVIGYDKKTDEYIFCDCAAESPAGRRSICYDQEALDSRKEHKPKNSALGMAESMGIEILSEEQYREIQKFVKFDSKTSSWIKTPDEIRELGGAIFCDFRFGKVFTYHNGAESYYSGRAFRGLLKV